MKKAMDKLLNNIKFDKKYVLFSLVLTIIGIIAGSLFVVVLNSSDKNLIIEYIQKFISDLSNNEIDYINILKNTSIVNYIVIIALLTIGFTYFSFPVNILILFYKSFVIGFSISSFILTYKIKGVFFSFVYTFPHLIINILIFCLLTAFTTKLSINMIKYIIKKKEINMREYINKYLSVFIMFAIIIGLTSVYESFVVPFFIKIISKILI